MSEVAMKIYRSVSAVGFNPLFNGSMSEVCIRMHTLTGHPEIGFNPLFNGSMSEVSSSVGGQGRTKRVSILYLMEACLKFKKTLVIGL